MARDVLDTLTTVIKNELMLQCGGHVITNVEKDVIVTTKYRGINVSDIAKRVVDRFEVSKTASKAAKK